MHFGAIERQVRVGHAQGVIEQAVAGNNALWLDKGFLCAINVIVPTAGNQSRRQDYSHA